MDRYEFSMKNNKMTCKTKINGETVNYFMVNGNRVINHKTLEENHIYDSSIVTLYQDA